ncbi:hypothetical protein [Sphingomonas sp. BK069]|uniref:hypothetical protein n=1 Tax=Sphingomonas sp. BK069 TaxID=2586979 RepID=UPI00160BB476|nr:hypothetical protein [Sphingomonas sp. BK069]MBB3345970.1 hypothetical protein [Sphingomonas sp. BK069]
MARQRCEFLALTRDWLDVRLPLHWTMATSWFEHAIGDAVVAFEPPGRAGYRAGLKAASPVNSGSISIIGDNPRSLGWSLLSATGGAAEWGWNAAAHGFDVVQANRIDAALDFRCSQRTFDRLFDELTGIVRVAGLRPHPVGDAEWGRTCYVNWPRKLRYERTGNEKAATFTGRLYEKGKELGQDPDWRRFEVVMRPDKPEKKERAFLLEPHEIIGSPAWSRSFLTAIGYNEAVKPGRASPFATPGPVSIDARVARRMKTLAHMGEQYGESVRELVNLIGEEETRRLVELALFRPVIVDPNGREISGPALIQREAQIRWDNVFVPSLRRPVSAARQGS